MTTSRDGTNYLDNLQLLCGVCNSLKGCSYRGEMARKSDPKINVGKVLYVALGSLLLLAGAVIWPDIGSLGLLVDIVGAILLFLYGLPNHVSINKTRALPLEHAAKWLKETDQLNPLYVRYKRLSRLGIGLLIIGFAMQIVDNCLN